MTPEEVFAKRLKRCSNSLRKLLADAKKVWPEANLYVEEDCLCLLFESSHDSKGNRNQDSVIALEQINGIGGGAW